ncbi:PREDICTED: odorant receptor 2a-like [Dinoponera quadriceps]|uniref:Odorant receptor 2a-like n=1 Tax=Dinoponera quadriceps TaxID=609295 RepID=A0A6P3XPD6_DINQU|nr:PREDICTED: odorant receptor 2a-like [Dinoponera quadriceps]
MMADDWIANSDMEMRETTNKAKTSDCINNGAVVFHAVNVIVYSFVNITIDTDVTDHTNEIIHIHKIPFDIRTQSIYRFVLIIELVHFVVCAVAICILNILPISFTLHVGGQIDILHCWLAELVVEGTGKKSGSVVSMIPKIIRKHQKIIRLSENIVSMYSLIALVHFISNVIIICLVGFLFITATGNSDTAGKIVRSLTYCVTNVEGFIFRCAGEYLMNKSKAIGHAAYDTAWCDMQPKHCRILLFIILRSQKQLTLTVGKLMDLSLQTFASIMNCAASYLTVLLAMQ